jgi:alpha-N-arabinofuranosidase
LANGAARREAYSLIDIDLNRSTPISPLIFGQFIEFIGHTIGDGIYEPGSPLSDQQGFRQDVLAKAKGLRPTILRYPGGTFSKIYHWKDGVGAISQRPARPNLIWNGTEDNHFGTDEFVKYCRELDAAPFITVNMATGTAEEAAQWVEYCNRSEGTSYSDLRRRNGFDKPYNIRYWGLGNEEEANEDPGRLQNADNYCREAWLYAKLMKLEDPTVRLVVAGGDDKWNEAIIKGLHPIADYISLHLYIGSTKKGLFSILADADACEKAIRRLKMQIDLMAPASVKEFSPYYRFPPREAPMMIALDEIGILGPRGILGTDVTYSWKDALAAATLYNIVIRNADSVGVATWALLVNTLAPIISDSTSSICQTIYYVMSLFRQVCGNRSLLIHCDSPKLNLPGAAELPCLDVSASQKTDSGSVTVVAVNRHPTLDIQATLPFLSSALFSRTQIHELTAASEESANTLEKPRDNAVQTRQQSLNSVPRQFNFKAHSITALTFS